MMYNHWKSSKYSCDWRVLLFIHLFDVYSCSIRGGGSHGARGGCAVRSNLYVRFSYHRSYISVILMYFRKQLKRRSS